MHSMSSVEHVWVDHANPVLRRGIVACLEDAKQLVAGSGAGLHPVPDFDDVGVLLFDAEATGAERAAAVTHGRELRLIGLVGEPRREGLQDLQRAGVSAVLGTRTLTRDQLVACVKAVQRLPGSSRPRRMLVGTAPTGAQRFSAREVDVLRLLADGASTRDIAEQMNYSERTVKNIVHDVLVKLRGRTRAQAVAVAARSGVI
jgi:DNA-binding NarL/FixJ family response regulator